METYGWDIVFACSIGRMNTLMAANMSQLITSFDYSDDNIEMSGEFGVWKIVEGGSNKSVHFELPIKSGNLTIKMFHKTIKLDGVIPVMALQLAFIDNTRVANQKDLKFDCQIVGKSASDNTPGAVFTVTSDATGKLHDREVDPTGLAWSMMHDNMPKCLIANKDKLAFVFSSVDLAANWLSPKRFEYVYAEPAKTNQGMAALGILGVVTDRDTSHLKRNIDPNLLSDSYELFMMIAPDIFLQQTVMPGLPRAYGHGATANNFYLSGAEIRNNGNLNCGSVKVGLIRYYPYIDSLSIKIDDTALLMSASGRFDITGFAKAYVTFTMGATNQCKFNASTQQINFEKDPHPTKNYAKHIPWWEYVVAAIGGGIIIAVVDTVIAVVTSSVASSVSNSLNAGGQLSTAKLGTETVRWHGLENFAVKEAGLSDAFYLRGNYQSS
jgi:hypothetical protein